MQASPFEVLIFDFDYTLFDTSGGVVECMQRAFEAADQDVPCEASIRSTIGLPLPEAIVSLNSSLSEGVVAHIEKNFLTFADTFMVERTLPIHPVPHLLTELTSQGFKLALLTGKYRARVEKTLEKYGLLDCFDVIVCGDEVRGKPEPEGITKIFDTWRHKHRTKFVMIGDHYLDILTARNVGIDCISVSTGKTSLDVLQSYKPLVVIADLGMLRAALVPPVKSCG